jgi:DNA mismatch repair ATPase MutS
LSLQPFRFYDPGAFMRLPEATLRALEVFEPLRGQDTLFSVLDETRTALAGGFSRAGSATPFWTGALWRRGLTGWRASCGRGPCGRG